MKNELQTLRLFSPLFPHIYPFNEWGDLEDDMVEVDANELLQYTDEIEALIQKAQHPSEDKHGLAIYIHDESLRTSGGRTYWTAAAPQERCWISSRNVSAMA